MKRQFGVFLIRWVLNACGLWITVRVFGTGYSDSQLQEGLWVFAIAALIFSIVNATLKPLAVVLALPAILLTLGLFTIIINGTMVYVSIALTPSLTMTFWHSVLAGMVLSLLNYIVSTTFESRRNDRNKESL